jgi:hypothetical protein
MDKFPCKKTKSPHNRGDFYIVILNLIQDLSTLLYMLKTQFTLIAKRDLTHDVYELTYNCPDLVREPPQP